jgi:hypothetical protein
VGETLRRRIETEARLDPRDVRRPVLGLLEAELGHDALAVLGREEQRDAFDLGEEASNVLWVPRSPGSARVQARDPNHNPGRRPDR